MHLRREIMKDGSLWEFVKCTGWNFAANISSKITLDVSYRLAKEKKELTSIYINPETCVKTMN